MSTTNGWNNTMADASAITLNAGTNDINISTNAGAANVNVGTGAAAKVVTVGSTNGASSLALKTGTGDFSLASATGNVIVALDTGEVTKPLQPAFLARLSANTAASVTGDGTQYTVICDTEIYDQNGDYNNGTGIFTAPVAGKYLLIWNAGIFNLGAAHTTQIPYIVTTARTYILYNQSFTTNPLSQASWPGSVIADMAAGDTATFKVYVAGSTKTVGVAGGAVFGAGDATTFVSGALVC